MTNAIIVCGGLSTRLGEITKSIPKVLLEIGDKTVLDWQLDSLKQVGIDQVILAGGHLSDVLEREVGNSRRGVTIIYAIESNPLGTGGAIKNAFCYITSKDAPTIVVNGDILTSEPYKNILNSLDFNSDGVIFGVRVPDASSYGTLDFDQETGLLHSFEEKRGVVESGFINGGVYVFTDKIYNYLPSQNKFSMEYDVFPHMENLSVYSSDKDWIDVGVPDRLIWARDNWHKFLVN